jgi:AAA15 family ATPase/GTPase
MSEIRYLTEKRNDLFFSFSEKYYSSTDGDYPFSPVLRTSYFPAFRTMIEAWASVEDKEYKGYYGETRRDRPHDPSFFAKKWFGPFTPNITFKSIQMISSELKQQIFEAQREIRSIENISINEAFSEIIKSVSDPKESGKDVDQILNQILKLSDDYSSLPFRGQSGVSNRILKQIQDLNKKNLEEGTARAIVRIYYDYLKRIYDARVSAFEHIQRYLDSVNKFFLPKKKIVVDEEMGFSINPIGVQFKNSEQVQSLRALSSGERQILTMVYSATDMNDEDLVLIDEPEISLHVDWQRVLLSRMSELMGKDKQIIATTHSPTIAADYLDQLINFDKLIDRSEGK